MGAVDGVESFSMPDRRGFPAVVQYIVEELYPECDRLVLVNPDALVSEQGLIEILATEADLVIPSIVSPDGTLENIREVTRPSWEILNLAFGEKYRGDRIPFREDGRIVVCPPYAPSGAVIAIKVELLKQLPLRSDFFWLEFSDWIRRHQEAVSLRIVPTLVKHTGASTSVKYPISVAASQVRAKVGFVREYGGPLQKVIVVPALWMRAIRFGVRRRSVSAALRVGLSGMGLRDWRVSR